MLSIEKAINTALEYENKVTSVYRTACRQVNDPVGKKVFKVLADEEQNHVDYLNAKLDEWKKTGTLKPETLETAIPSPEKIRQEVGKLEKRMAVEDRNTEIQLLQKALEMEIETSTFYKRMVEELSHEGQQLFARFVEIEEGHQAIVQAELDSVSGLGFWFDFREFNLEGA